MSHTTFTLIAYDIPNDKRRTKVHKLLSGFGKWTQFSVFECFLTDKEWIDLQHKLETLTAPHEDSIRIYRLCTRCVEMVQTIGGQKPSEDALFLA
jgi:CRISPR-associated protein Cas2